MDDWKREIEAELGSALKKLDSLTPAMEGILTRDQLEEIWDCYISVEKGVVFVKLELEEEQAARFVQKKAYSVPDDRQAVSFAALNLRTALGEVEAGNLSSALKALRESRNYLRMLLRRERLAARKRAASTRG